MSLMFGNIVVAVCYSNPNLAHRSPFYVRSYMLYKKMYMVITASTKPLCQVICHSMCKHIYLHVKLLAHVFLDNMFLLCALKHFGYM